MLFDRWCSSKEIAQDFSRLRQLVLIEEFKGCIPTSIKTYIEEQKAESIQQAARLADHYCLTHRGSFEGSTVDSSSASVVKTDLARASTTPTFPRSNSSNQRRSVVPGPVCNYCKHRGYVLAECWALERKRASNPVMTVVKAKYKPQEGHEEKSETSPGKENPFISEGFVSLT